MSRHDRTSIYIDSEGPNEDAVEQAFAWLYQVGEQDEDKRNALLAVNTKRQLEGVVSDVIGEQAANELDKKNPVSLGQVELRLMTKRIDPGRWNGGPILAIYPDKKLLDKTDGMHNVTDVLMVPWSKAEVEFWIDTWGATELGSGSGGGGSATISEPVVAEAVETLDRLVNTSTGVTHSSDRSTAIEIFKTLHEAGISFDPAEIRAWLVAENGWKPDHADDVKEIAEGVRAGKRFQYREGGLKDDILDQWKERAADS